MLKLTKVLLIAGGALFALGLVITVGGALALRSDLAKKAESGNAGYEKKEVVVTDDFSNIKISEISHDIKIVESDGDEVKVEYYDSERYVHSVDVKGDTLTVGVNSLENGTPWWEMVTFDIDWIYGETNEDYQMIVYLPAGEYGSFEVSNVSSDMTVPEGYAFEDMTVNTTSGDIDADCSVTGQVKIGTVSGEVKLDIGTPSDVTVNTTSGNVNLDDMTVAGLVKVSTVSGEITLANVVTDDVDVNTTSGDIKFDSLTTETANIDTTSGDVSGKITGDHEYDVNTVSGDIDIASNIKGEPEFSISTVSGDVDIEAA